MANTGTTGAGTAMGATLRCKSGWLLIGAAIAGVLMGTSGALAQAFPLRVKLLTTPEEQRSATSQPAEFTRVGATVYFVAQDEVNGRELWKTDGTAEGTVLVRDTWPGNSTSNGPRNLFNFNGVLLFAASDGERGLELWRSDGTATGTVMVKEIEPGGIGSEPRNYIDGGDQVFFDATVSQGEAGFWRTDGTSAGTYRVKVGGACCFGDGSCQVLSPPVCEIMRGWVQAPLSTCGAVMCDQPVAFVCCLPNGLCKYLYAASCSQQGGDLLPAGSTCQPRMCPALPPAACCLPDQQCILLTEMDCVDAGGSARGVHATCSPADLCVCAPQPCTPAFVRCCFSDGSCRLAQNSTACTAAGGVGSGVNITCEAATIQCVQTLVGCCINDGSCRVDTLNNCMATGGMPKTYGNGVCATAVCPEPSLSAGAVGVPVRRVGSQIFIYNYDEFSTQRGLWVWDGTPTGFTFLRTFPPFNSNYLQIPRYFTELNGKLLFAMSDGNTGYEWWRSDGTPAGTVLVTDINPGAAHAVQISNATATPVKAGGHLYFFAEDGSHGRQLWRTDGTEAGTSRLTSLANLGNSTGPIMPVGDGVVFFAYPSTGRNWLYRLDASDPAGCSVLSTVEFSTSMDPSLHCSGGGRAFFGQNGLWATDGTVEGTFRVVDRDTTGYDVQGLRWVAGPDRVFFNAGEPWISDGTAAGTAPLRDISSGLWSHTIKPLGGDWLIFPAAEAATGLEPYISDGTPAGTRLLKDVNPGTAHSLPQNFTPVDTGDGRRVVYFTADSPGFTQTLWMTDGTASGTRSVGDPDYLSLREGVSASPAPRSGSTTYFRGGTDSSGLELYKTDGTRAGTGFVAELLPGPAGGLDQVVFSGATTNGVFCFNAVPGLYGTDGTTNGTRLLRATAGPDVRELTEFQGLAYFTNAWRLWRTDGTPIGTTVVEPGDVPPYYIRNLTVVGERMFFSASDGGTTGGHGSELWVSTGLPGQSVRLCDANPGTASSDPYPIMPFHGNVAFMAYSPRWMLWYSDGTPAGTRPFFAPGVFPYDIQYAYTWRDKIFLVTYQNSQLWVVDALDAPPVLLTGPLDSFHEPAAVGDRLYFILRFHSSEEGWIWATDGTPGGTYRAVDSVEFGGANYIPHHLIAVGSNAYFVGGGSLGREWYRVDPSSRTARLALDFLPGAAEAFHHPVGAYGEDLLFTAVEPLRGGGLYRLRADTGVERLGFGPGSFAPFRIAAPTAGNGLLYFTEQDESCCPESQLFRTDGTSAGTRLVADFSRTPQSFDYGVRPLTAVNDSFLCTGRRSTTGVELYRIDDLLGAVALPELVPGTGGWGYYQHGIVGTQLFFGAAITGDSQNIELGVTDGTTTRAVADIRPGLSGSNPRFITALNGTVLFVADDGAHGSELWRSDGTAQGTRLVKDIVPGDAEPGILGLVVMGDHVYFAATTPEYGRELWKSDGTEGGTVLVRDVWIGPSPSSPSWLTPTGNRLHFVAYTPETGPELWITDGTPGGTFMLFQLADGPGGANINQLTVSGNRLYFLATTLPEGTGLWTYDWPGALRAFCPADYDRVGGVGVGDIFSFLVDWFTQASRADFSGDGSVGVQDIFDFLAAYFAGCP